MSKIKTQQDVLDEDPEIVGQKYVLVSFLTPEKIKDTKSKGVRGLKIRGCFATREEAENHSKYLREQVDNRFDIYVGEIGKWLPWDDSDRTEDEDYAEKELNDLMKAYRQQRILSKQELDKRRNEEVRKAAEEREKALAAKNA